MPGTSINLITCKLSRIRRNAMFTDTEEVYIEEDSTSIK
jgi:hypothetical protein